MASMLLSLGSAPATSFLSSLPLSKAGNSVVPQAVSSPVLKVSAAASSEADSTPTASRRDVLRSAALGLSSSALLLLPLPALADFESDYANLTSTVIERVRYTLALDRDDPSRSEAVTALRQLSNDWVARYRREKAVSGRPSFSNMYSVLNAISGHYISFGPTYPIPKKRADRIMEEIEIAEKALARGR